MVVARVEPDGHFDVLDREKEVVRLGSGAGVMRRLTPEAIERGIDALGRLRRIADGFGATIDAVATSALREALNRDEFLQRARDEIGIDVDIVSGVEEARLIHLGVIHFVPLVDERILVIDIGGGSTELVVGEHTDVLLARSLKLGRFASPTASSRVARSIRRRLVSAARTCGRSWPQRSPTSEH